MSKPEDKAYYRINDPDGGPEGDDSEMSTGKKRTKKKLIIVVSVAIVVVIAIVVLLLVLLLGRGGSIPSGYNGFVEQESVNMRHAYLAHIRRENNADVPIEFGPDNKEFVDVDFHVCMVSSRTWRISYRPQEQQLDDNIRWTVPDNYLENIGCDQRLRLSFGEFEVDQAPFGFSLRNPTHRNTFWLSTKDRNLVMSDKYMEVGFEIHSQQVFGWGERTRAFTLEEGEYTIWPTGIEKGVDPGERGYNTFGDHPFVLARLSDKTYIGLYLKNSNAKVLKYLKEPQGRSVINFRAMGGIMDVFAFMGDTAEQVLREFHRVVGEPGVPPLWSLGFQQGSADFIDYFEVMKSVKNYSDAGIPLESVLLDESFMDNYRTFTVNKDTWKHMSTLTKELHNAGQRLVVSLHSCIPVYDSSGNVYSYFSEGLQEQVFIKSQEHTGDKVTKDAMIGEFLPGKCAYVDFHDPSAYSFWTRSIANLWSEVNYDGLQLNYNEIYQHCDGECPQEPDSDKKSGRFSNLPYNPMGDTKHKLDSNTIALDARLYNATQNHTHEWVAFNNMGIYGTQMMALTDLFLENGYRSPLKDKRSFVVSRSTYSGSGQYGGHFISNLECTFEDMKHSVASILNFNIFGVPLTGADVCGTTGKVDQEVCGRWYQLASVYPYARSYYNSTSPRDAWALDGKYKEAAKNALVLRMSLIRYFYTILYEINENGGSFWRPLFFEFPEDDGAVNDPEHTFMIGKALKFTPVLKSIVENGTIGSYFPPNTRFIDIITWDIIEGKGKIEQLPARWDFPLIHMKEGTIIPYQAFADASTTDQLVKERMINLFIFPDHNKNADGTVFIDSDGLSTFSLDTNTHQYYRLTFSDRMIRFVIVDGYDAGGRLDMNQIVDNVTIVNAEEYNDTDFACMFNENMEPLPLNFTYDEKTKSLHLRHDEDGTILDLRNIRGIQFGNSKTDKSFCNVKYTVSSVTTTQNGPNAGKSMVVAVEANSYDLSSFNVHFNLIKDNLINVDFCHEIDPPPFEIPSLVLNETLYPFTESFATGDITSYVTVPGLGEDFYFEIHTKDNPSDVLFSTKDQPLVYTRYYKSMGAKLHSNNRVFGLGERFGEFWRDAGTYSVWNRADDHVFEDGEPPGKNLYGSHPVYFAQKKSGTEFFGVYEHNSGPQEFVIEPARDGPEINNIKTTGRTNMFFMMNEHVEQVVQNFYDLVGKPAMMPRWAFGWHQSRFGYNTTQALKDVYNGYRNKSMPLDGLWSDVDILDDFRDFTFEEEFFDGVQEFLNSIKETGTRYVPIIGAGISAGDSPAYFDGIKKGVFIKSPGNRNAPLIGRSTPGDVVFVDFFFHDAQSYWIDQMNKFQEKLPFDGVWLDMNEITNYCNAVCYADQRAPNPVDNRLFYWPGGRDLEIGTISIDAQDETGNLQLDTHSLYGLMQSYYTSLYWKQKDERGFVISRSTFAGSGKYAGHWLGDNDSEFLNLRYSVDNILLFNSFGIPFTGADICGFNGNTSDTLCTQWYKVAALVYPFARNHNDLVTREQEPYADRFNDTADPNTKMTGHEIMKKAMMVRYGMHLYMYTQFHKASTEGIQPIKPLFYSFPEDSFAYEYIYDNVMIGDHIKASPDTSFFSRSTYYFPDANLLWCPIWEDYRNECIQGGTREVVDQKVSQMYVHIKSGSIIPIQLSNSSAFPELDVKNLDDLENYYTDIGLLFNNDNVASGDVIFDDGLTTNLTQHDHIAFLAEAESHWWGKSEMEFSVSVLNNQNTAPMTNSQRLGQLIIYNAGSLGFRTGSKGELVDVDGNSYELTSVYDSSLYLTRVTYEADEAIPIKKIASIHLEASG